MFSRQTLARNFPLNNQRPQDEDDLLVCQGTATVLIAVLVIFFAPGIRADKSQKYSLMGNAIDFETHLRIWFQQATDRQGPRRQTQDYQKQADVLTSTQSYRFSANNASVRCSANDAAAAL